MVVLRWTVSLDSHNALFHQAVNSHTSLTFRTNTEHSGGYSTLTVSQKSRLTWSRYHSHYSNTLADGIHGALIVHSPNDPLKRGQDFDEEQVVIVSDW
jgi:FtsP/CotA-like multicopper oxidase with cupredoxin domain